MNNQALSADHSQSTGNERAGVQNHRLLTAIRFDSKGVYLSHRAVAVIFSVLIAVAVSIIFITSRQTAAPPCELTYHTETVFNSQVEEIERRYVIAGWKVEKESYTPAGAMLQITFSRCE